MFYFYILSYPEMYWYQFLMIQNILGTHGWKRTPSWKSRKLIRFSSHRICSTQLTILVITGDWKHSCVSDLIWTTLFPAHRNASQSLMYIRITREGCLNIRFPPPSISTTVPLLAQGRVLFYTWARTQLLYALPSLMWTQWRPAKQNNDCDLFYYWCLLNKHAKIVWLHQVLEANTHSLDRGVKQVWN